ncbi:Spermidine synthase [Hypsibius exemplaris]|uniref:Spermidine synthase n=1 Tax=Hypsibius exemplaris TaxID=2072580 RepID=A0A1W0XB87_HYPEX|nr:Spermidine synthase [Hypsibius exemplaris]
MDAQKVAGSSGAWFSEVSAVCPGQSFSLEIEKVLYHKRSLYQDVLVFQSKTYGRVLALDGMIQVTERDEFAYQEMLAHLPMFSHPSPHKVLIVGGGDGGILREVLKHEAVETVVQCEIDADVVSVSKEWLPFLSSSFQHPKLHLHIGDGFEFLKNHPAEFDVIITDSSDPIGPAESLFGEGYFQLLAQALRPHGLVALQGESVWLHLELIKSMTASCRKWFPVVEYAWSSVPSYPSGQIGYILCSSNHDTHFRRPLRHIEAPQLATWNLRYYDADVHAAAFVLPKFASENLSSS